MKTIIKILSFISYWFFVWFILFIFGIVKANPLFFLIIALIFILTQVVYLYLTKASFYNLTKYIIINLFIKIIPIFILILYYPISFNYDDISFGLTLILIYIITMMFLGVNPILAYYKIINIYKSNNNDNYNNDKTEVSKLYDNIYNFIYNQPKIKIDLE